IPIYFEKTIDKTNLLFISGRRRIIKGISGHFKSGELTAIMGPSGAGKSSVMNILVGYVTSGVSGSIKLNGQLRQMRTFHKISSYIMQEDLLQPYLTVRESMLITAHLKLGPHLKVKEKKAIIEEILATLGLTTCGDTKNESLSGGQRKRVSIALELVNNPPVIFLDEPTTGLDVVSINQCLHMLKLLASQGRTIVCTLHQPSSSLFNLLDRVYMLAQGKCIYQGAANQLVPFLADSSLLCPSTHNPADYNPEQVKLMKREYFNRWYSLKAFYCAITVSTVPIIMMLGFLFTIIVYFMSDQPVEPKRFGWFTLICTLLALISEGLGILIGFTFNCTVSQYFFSLPIILGQANIKTSLFNSRMVQWLDHRRWHPY
ncbi:hypothetical protein AAG570_006480, partial [Ranatra chinensis]